MRSMVGESFPPQRAKQTAGPCEGETHPSSGLRETPDAAFPFREGLRERRARRISIKKRGRDARPSPLLLCYALLPRRRAPRLAQRGA